MDSNGIEAKVEPIIGNLKPQKEVVEGVLDKEKDDESQSLLLLSNGEMSIAPSKTRRKVQWNDTNGNKLAEVMEFQPRVM